MFKIDIHTHILPENLNEITDTFSDSRFLRFDYIDSKSGKLQKDGLSFRQISCNCWDLSVRKTDCDKTNVDIQVLSTLPVLFSYWAQDDESLILARFLNDHIYNCTIKEPNRFIGLGTIPMQNTNMAIEEMDRCINTLNFPGIEIGTNVNGKNLSNPDFFPIFEHAEKIGCSIFIHPWEMMGQNKMQSYWLPWLVGMPAETSRAVCSLIFGGIFEKYPDLKIAFAHGGGSFPYISGRVDHGYNVRPDLCKIDSSVLPSTYLKHFYVDSLVHNQRTLVYLLESMGSNQIAMGSDYPFPLGEHIPGKLIESMDISSIIKQRLLAGTAIEWLGLDKAKYIE